MTEKINKLQHISVLSIAFTIDKNNCVRLKALQQSNIGIYPNIGVEKNLFFMI